MKNVIVTYILKQFKEFIVKSKFDVNIKYFVMSLIPTYFASVSLPVVPLSISGSWAKNK